MLRKILLEHKIVGGIQVIGTINFLNTKIKVYYDSYSKKNDFMVGWKYVGSDIVFQENYYKGIVDESLEPVRSLYHEIMPQYIILGIDYLNSVDKYTIINLIIKKLKENQLSKKNDVMIGQRREVITLTLEDIDINETT